MCKVVRQDINAVLFVDIEKNEQIDLPLFDVAKAVNKTYQGLYLIIYILLYLWV